jgi:hypothetical protein
MLLLALSKLLNKNKYINSKYTHINIYGRQIIVNNMCASGELPAMPGKPPLGFAWEATYGSHNKYKYFKCIMINNDIHVLKYDIFGGIQITEHNIYFKKN